VSDKPRVRKLIAENRKARHDYDLLDTVVAGLVLTGSEVKSLRAGQGNIGEAFVVFRNGEAFLVNAHFAAYANAGYAHHSPRRERKLLLKVKELVRLFKRISEKGLTLVPLELYFDGPWVKLKVGLGRGRKSYDKRQAIKEREGRREMQQALRRR
jgi:SsrA-binding protein